MVHKDTSLRWEPLGDREERWGSLGQYGVYEELKGHLRRWQARGVVTKGDQEHTWQDCRQEKSPGLVGLGSKKRTGRKKGRRR